MSLIARFWDVLPRLGNPPSSEQPGIYAPKMQAIARQSANWSSVAVMPCGMDLNPASRVLRFDSVALIGCPRGVSFVLALVLGESADSGRGRQTGSAR